MFVLGLLCGIALSLLLFRVWLVREVPPPRRSLSRGVHDGQA